MYGPPYHPHRTLQCLWLCGDYFWSSTSSLLKVTLFSSFPIFYLRAISTGISKYLRHTSVCQLGWLCCGGRCQTSVSCSQWHFLLLLCEHWRLLDVCWGRAGSGWVGLCNLGPGWEAAVNWPVPDDKTYNGWNSSTTARSDPAWIPSEKASPLPVVSPNVRAGK